MAFDPSTATLVDDGFDPNSATLVEAPQKTGLIDGAMDFVGNAMNSVREFATGANPKKESVLQSQPWTVEDKPLIESRGAPVTQEYADGVRKGLELSTQGKRDKAGELTGFMGSVSRAQNRQIEQAKGSVDAVRQATGGIEDRAERFIEQGAGPNAALSLAQKEIISGDADAKYASPVYDEALSDLAARKAADFGLSALQIPPTVVKGLADITQLISADTLGGGTSKFAGQLIQDLNASKSTGAQIKSMELQRILENKQGTGVNVLAYMLENPDLIVEMGLPSIGSMAVTVGGAAMAGRIAQSLKFIQKMPAVEREVLLNSIKTGAAITGNTLLNAGDTFNETKGDLSQKYTAAGIAGLGSLLSSLATGGGAEGAIARGLRGGIGSKVEIAGKVMLKENLQEFGEGASQSIGQQFAETGGVDFNKAVKQGTLESILAGPMGAAVGVAEAIRTGAPVKPKLNPSVVTAPEVDTVDKAIQAAQAVVNSSSLSAAQKAGAEWQALGITNPQDDLALQRQESQSQEIIQAASNYKTILNATEMGRQWDSVRPIGEPRYASSELPDQTTAIQSAGTPAISSRADATSQNTATSNTAPVPVDTALPATETVANNSAPNPIARTSDVDLLARVEDTTESLPNRESAVAQQQQDGVVDTTEVVNTAEFGGKGFAVAPLAQKETVGELTRQQAAVDGLAREVEGQGESGASNIEVVGNSGTAPTFKQSIARRVVSLVGRAAQSAFGLKTVAVTGINGYGVAYGGYAMINTDDIGSDAGSPKSIAALAIGVIGHEGGHVALERSADPQDRIAYENLKTVIHEHLQDGVIDRQLAFENEAAARATKQGETPKAVSREYAHNEVIQNINGAMWLDHKFWDRVYEIDNGSTMRRVAYRFMSAATKFINAAKGSDLDIKTLVKNVEAVREIVAQTWAQKAMRNGQAISRSQINTLMSTAPTAPVTPYKRKAEVGKEQSGVYAEVAPDPRDTSKKQGWDSLNDANKQGITRKVMDRVFADVAIRMGLKGWSIEYTTGMYEKGVNPSSFIKAPAGTALKQLSEVSRVLGYILDQKGMIAFDESNTSSDSQAGFVKVVLPEGMPQSRIDQIRIAIANAVPQADGDTFRGGLVFGNFSGYSSNPITDNQFRDAIKNAVAAISGKETIEVKEVKRFHSDFTQAYEGQKLDNDQEAYEPDGRKKFLEGTRYASSRLKVQAGRDGVRGRSGDSVHGSDGAWLKNLADTTDREVAGLIASPAFKRKGRPGRVSTENDRTEVRGAVHYGKSAGLSSLSGSSNGTGIKGAEQERLKQATDQRIKKRVYFYLPTEGGIPNPEAGLGQHVYSADLKNLYNAVTTTKPIRGADNNALESAILDAGYDGYINQDQGIAVVLNKDVPVEYLGTSDEFDKTTRAPVSTKPKVMTRTEGSELVRRPDNSEVLQIIKAQPSLKIASPSFVMQYGEARVLASEASVADAVLSDAGSTFQFGEPSYKRRYKSVDDVVYDEDTTGDLGNFNLDAVEVDKLDKKDIGDLDFTNPDDDALAALADEAAFRQDDALAALADEAAFRQRMVNRARRIDNPQGPKAVTKESMAQHGLFPERAFEHTFGVPELNGDSVGSSIGMNPNAAYPHSAITKVDDDQYKIAASAGWFDNGSKYTKNVAINLFKAHLVRGFIHDSGYDLASAYKKGTNLKIAKAWLELAKAKNAFKYKKSTSTDFTQIGKELDAFSGYSVTADSANIRKAKIYFTDKSTNQTYLAFTHSSELADDDGFAVNTINLKGSRIGTAVYAVLGQWAKNQKEKFYCDTNISAVNTFRRTEQSFSFAIKTGDSTTLLPGRQNRVYGFDEFASTPDEHLMNIARLAIANMRNAMEVLPDTTTSENGSHQAKYNQSTSQWLDENGSPTMIGITRLSLDPETGVFTDSSGKDVTKGIQRWLNDPKNRGTGIGESTLARAVITNGIIMGKVDANEVNEFAKPIAYSRKKIDVLKVEDAEGVAEKGYTKEQKAAALIEKFKRMRDFHNDRDSLVTQIERDANTGKEEAVVLRLIAHTGFRIGGGMSKTGPTYGASTLKPEHVTVAGDVVRFDFIGKSGVQQKHSIKNADIASDISKRMDRESLFKTADRAVRKYKDSLDGGKKYKVHDFRTWQATKAAQLVVNTVQQPTTPEEYKVAVRLALQAAASKIGDTLATTEEHYVDPQIFDGWRASAGIKNEAGVSEVAGKGEDGITEANDSAAGQGNNEQGVRDSEEGLGYKRKTSPSGFYSALTDSVENSPSKAQAQDGWRAYLKGQINKGAIKADEVEWSGVNDWLQMQTGKVTKEQVSAYLDANGVKVEEVTLSDTAQDKQKTFEDAQDRVEALEDRVTDEYGGTLSAQRSAVAHLRRTGWVNGVSGELATEYHQAWEAMQAADADRSNKSSRSKYSQYQLPGGENYREVLLVLPENGHADVEALHDATDKEYRRFGNSEKYTDLRKQLIAAQNKLKTSSYQSSHWEQKNVLAHIRLNDRTDATGAKVLLVEEIQSDLAQDYRKSKDAINKAVDADFAGIIERMKKAGVLEVNCD